MSFDGTAESENIFARLGALAGGRIYEGVPDDAELAIGPDGKILPYIDCLFNAPIQSARDRRLAVGEQEQPQVLAMTITASAADKKTARLLGAGILKLLLGWQPNGDNATALISPGGYAVTRTDTASKPTIWERGIYFTCVINQSTSD